MLLQYVGVGVAAPWLPLTVRHCWQTLVSVECQKFNHTSTRAISERADWVVGTARGWGGSVTSVADSCAFGMQAKHSQQATTTTTT